MKQFDSKDDTNPAVRPVLTIDYTVAPPPVLDFGDAPDTQPAVGGEGEAPATASAVSVSGSGPLAAAAALDPRVQASPRPGRVAPTDQEVLTDSVADHEAVGIPILYLVDWTAESPGEAGKTRTPHSPISVQPRTTPWVPKTVNPSRGESIAVPPAEEFDESIR